MMLPAGTRVHLAVGKTDMRKGIDGLAMMVQSVLELDPHSGHLFAFRGGKANLVKILYWDGNGMCLFSKRLDQGGFVWPKTHEVGGSVILTSAQLSMLIEGIDWRVPQQVWRPAKAG